jgi:hypothetical protein
MVRDYLYWRGDPSFVRRLMPGVRGIVDQFLAQGDSRGLIVAPIGGNFVDWAKGWRGGSPKDANEGVSSIIQLQLVVALAQIADVEEALGETELAARLRRRHGPNTRRYWLCLAAQCRQSGCPASSAASSNRRI